MINQFSNRDPCNVRGISSRPVRIHPVFTDTMSVRRPADALEVSMATSMASRDCEGQSEPINGTKLRDKNTRQRIKSQMYASCHFYSRFAKNCMYFLMVLCFFF